MEKIYVYFVLNPVTQEVKIGQSYDPEQRVKQLEMEEKTGLILLNFQEDVVPLEKRLHKKFDHLRSRGEWFRLEKELKKYITDVSLGRLEPKEEEQAGYTIRSIVTGWETVRALISIGDILKRSDVEIMASCSRAWAVNIINYGIELGEVICIRRGLYRYTGDKK